MPQEPTSRAKKLASVLTAKTVGFLLIVLAVVFSIYFIYISSGRELSDLENTLFQILSLGLGLFGSYKVGASNEEAAKEIIKPYAKSAFRRLLSLYRSLSRVAVVIADAKRGNHGEKPDSSVLNVLEAIVAEQLDTADDALEDWRDIVPEEVEELQLRVKRSEQQKLVSE